VENPKSEYRNPKQIRNLKVPKQQTKKTFDFGTFGFVSNFGFRASNLESALSLGSFVAILRPI
jgi:hypothetical protein